MVRALLTMVGLFIILVVAVFLNHVLLLKFTAFTTKLKRKMKIEEDLKMLKQREKEIAEDLIINNN